MGGGVPGQDWAFSSLTLRAWAECVFECVCWESVPVRERTRVCVCTPKGRHVTRNMSENTGVSVGGTAFAFFFNQKLNIFLFVFFFSVHSFLTVSAVNFFSGFCIPF